MSLYGKATECVDKRKGGSHVIFKGDYSFCFKDWAEGNTATLSVTKKGFGYADVSANVDVKKVSSVWKDMRNFLLSTKYEGCSFKMFGVDNNKAVIEFSYVEYEEKESKPSRGSKSNIKRMMMEASTYKEKIQSKKFVFAIEK